MYQLTQSTHFVFIGFLVRSIFIRYLLNRNDSVRNQRRRKKSLFIWLSYCVNCILVFEGRFDSYLSPSIYSAHLHSISPAMLNSLKTPFKSYNDSWIIRLYNPIHPSSSPITATISLSHTPTCTLPNRPGSWKRRDPRRTRRGRRDRRG